MNEGERIDGRADIYSFGIVLYEMLTGVPPFQADTPHRYLMMHASEQPKSLQQTNPTTTASPELEALIFRALEKDRNKRFATAREFGKDIEALIPTLDDKPGALPVLPTASELTAEPTRPSVDVRAPTLPDLATTVKTVKGVDQPLLVRTIDEPMRPLRRELQKLMVVHPGRQRRFLDTVCQEEISRVRRNNGTEPGRVIQAVGILQHIDQRNLGFCIQKGRHHSRVKVGL